MQTARSRNSIGILEIEMYNAEQLKKEAWVAGFKAGRSTQDEWLALEKIKKAAFDDGRRQGIEAGYAQGYADGLLRGQHDNIAHEKYQLEGVAQGKRLGFQAGFAAAQAQPQAKIEAAYEQGYRRAVVSPQQDEEMNDLLNGKMG